MGTVGYQGSSVMAKVTLRTTEQIGEVVMCTETIFEEYSDFVKWDESKMTAYQKNAQEASDFFTGIVKKSTETKH